MYLYSIIQLYAPVLLWVGWYGMAAAGTSGPMRDSIHILDRASTPMHVLKTYTRVQKSGKTGVTNPE